VFNITIQVPATKIPYINLSFLYFNIAIAPSLSATIDTLDISTKAGYIASSASIHAANTTVHTTAGSLRGNYTLGESLYLSTSAGSINVNVTVDTTIESAKGKLETRADAGSTHLTLQSPLEHRNRVASRHISHAGAVKLWFPREWEGVVEGRTMAGGIRMSGEGLEIVESSGFVEKYVRAVKGNDVERKGSVYITDTAGGITFTV
jgi:hypothetical protein